MIFILRMINRHLGGSFNEIKSSTNLRPQQINDRNLTSICACTASWVKFTACTDWRRGLGWG